MEARAGEGMSAGPSQQQQHEFLDLARAGRWEEVKASLQRQPSLINVQPAGRYTALHQAAWAGDVEMVRYLLSQRADIHAESQDGRKPHDVAALWQVKALLLCTAPSTPSTSDDLPELPDLPGASLSPPAPLHRKRSGAMALGSDAAEGEGDKEDKLLLGENAEGPRKTEVIDKEEENRLQLEVQAKNAFSDAFGSLIKSGDLGGICEEIRKNPGVLRKRGPVGETPLHLLVLYRHFDIAKLLVSRYPALIVDQYEQDLYKGETCLHLAIVSRRVDFVRFLLEFSHANGSLPALLGAKATGTFFQSAPCDYGQTALSFAVCNNLGEVVAELVGKYGASLDEPVDSHGNTLLHMAVRHRLTGMCDTLAGLWGLYAEREGAVPLEQRKNEEGLTPLCAAARSGIADVFDHMLQSACKEEWSFGPVTSMLMPLDDVDYIPGKENGAVEHIICGGHLELVVLPKIQELLSRKWDRFAQRLFMRKAQWALGCAMAFTAMLVSHPRGGAGHGDSRSAAGLRLLAYGATKACVLWLASSKLRIELREMCTEGLRRYLGCGAILFENAVSLVFTVAFLASQALEALELLGCGACATQRGLLAASALAAWLYMLWFLLGCELTGHLVVTIWVILSTDMVKFALLSVFFILGFSSALYISLVDPVDRGPRGLVAQMFESFRMMPFGFDSGAGTTGSVESTLLLLYTTLASVLLLNLLIAMMNDTYSSVSASARQQWLLERARIITSIEQEMAPDDRRKHTYWMELNDGKRYLQMRIIDPNYTRS